MPPILIVLGLAGLVGVGAKVWSSKKGSTPDTQGYDPYANASASANMPSSQPAPKGYEIPSSRIATAKGPTRMGMPTGAKSTPVMQPLGQRSNSITTLLTGSEPSTTVVLAESNRHAKTPTRDQLIEAIKLAPTLVRALVANRDGNAYIDRNKGLFDLVKKFQSLMNLYSDGLYGPVTAGALYYVLYPNREYVRGKSYVPPPYFYNDPRSIVVYRTV